MPEAQKIPFLKLFSAWKPGEELAGLVSGYLVTRAVIDKHTRSIRASVECPNPPGEELRRTMAAEKERRAEMAAYVRQADLLSEYRDRPDQAEDFFYIGLDSAFIDSDLQALAAEAGVEIWKLESREPVTEQDGIFEVHVLLDIRCGNMDALSRMAGEIDRREKSVFLKALSAEENEEGMLEGRMEVVYCYAEEKPQGRTGVHTD